MSLAVVSSTDKSYLTGFTLEVIPMRYAIRRIESNSLKVNIVAIYTRLIVNLHQSDMLLTRKIPQIW
jgi:hypothetical protein